ncbi:MULTISPECIES: GIY-YIG nuclease family protein [Microbacterium]|uniref:GIY-YIG nuclease family protein n=1 Tax=Microbacterium TaxID=33882 RepID=UPI0027D809DE|nr:MULTISPECIES: GIY-YIG nuclease family protein [Microbacterium]
MPWAYILECRGGALYVGSTGRELESRVWEHNNDDDLAASFTRKRRPVRLVYAEWFDAVELAFTREKQLQGWRREKKLALIAERGADLPRLSRCGPGPEASTSSATSAAAPGPEASTSSATSAAAPGPEASTSSATSAAEEPSPREVPEPVEGTGGFDKLSHLRRSPGTGGHGGDVRGRRRRGRPRS